MIKFRKYLNLKTPSLEQAYPTACCKYDSCGSHLTVAGHMTNVLFSLISGHLNNVIIKQNSCFNNKTFITHFCFKIKQIIKYVKDQTKP